MKKIFYPFILATLMLGACSDSNDGEPQEPNDGTEQPVQEDPDDQNLPTYTGVQKRSEKRGVSYNFQLPEQDSRTLAPGTSWSYNWGTDVSSEVSTAFSKYQMDYCPMSWNASGDIAGKIRNYVKAHPECKYILGYNEPNLTDQARMTPRQAADTWPVLESLAAELNVKLISPAMNYGTLANYGDPIKWLDEFFSYVDINKIDGIAIHCYMESSSAVAGYVKMFKKYGKPIWLTELCAWPSNQKFSIAAQKTYMSETLNRLEANPDVFRYAWFIPRGGGPIDQDTQLASNNLLVANKADALTDLGKIFVNMSSLDKTVYYTKDQIIPAEHYSSINLVEDDSSNSVHLRPTTDKTGILDVYDFKQDQWLEYQLDAPKAGTYQLVMRYSSFRNNEATITIDNGNAISLSLPNVDSKWTTLTTQVQLKAGKQTLRIKVTLGNIALNWLYFKD